MKKKISIIISIFFLFLIFNSNHSFSTYISSDINGIDTTKYPGYKEKIQNLKQNHKNWTIRLLYTGLDWNYSVESERTGHRNIT